MTTTTYRPIDLFGGALTASLPSTFEDASNLRQIPDHQEVYLDQDGFTSIVFDILERVDKPDEEALRYHLDDIVDEDAGEMNVWSTDSADFAKLPTGTPCYTIFATSPPGEKQRGRPNEPDFVGILLMLVRLVEQKTDLVVTINVPHVPGNYEISEVDPGEGKPGKLLELAMGYREKVMKTFEIRDWGLFVQE